MFVMSYIRQNKKRKQTLESAQWGLEITFKTIGRKCVVCILGCQLIESYAGCL